MFSDRIEKLRQEYTDQYVVVDAERPELARFKGMLGQVKTVNFNGRALVEFDGHNNKGWYDVELDYLKVVDKPQPKPAAAKDEAAATDEPAAADSPVKKVEVAPERRSEEKLSPLELARLEREAEKPGQKPESNDTAAAGPADNNNQRWAEGPQQPAPEKDSGKSESN